MVAGRLPDEGPVRLGPVTLPAGRLITGYPGLDHVAWVTADPVLDSGRIWAALSELHPWTGLIPIQVDGSPGKVWDPLNLSETEDPRDADGLDAGPLLEDMWRDWLGPPEEDDPEWIRMRAPFTREFPGLAPPEHTPLTPAGRQHALDVVTQEARIGLIAAGLARRRAAGDRLGRSRQQRGLPAAADRDPALVGRPVRRAADRRR